MSLTAVTGSHYSGGLPGPGEKMAALSCGLQFQVPFRRIGEAKCPGPRPPKKGSQTEPYNSTEHDTPLQDDKQGDDYPSKPDMFQISIVNPTSINGRSKEVCSWGDGIHFLAETACTQPERVSCGCKAQYDFLPWSVP